MQVVSFLLSRVILKKINKTNTINEKRKKEKKHPTIENGIIIRQLGSYQLPHCLRITIGSLDDMKKIVSVLEKHKWQI